MRKKLKEYVILIIILVFFFLLLLSRELKCLFNELTGLYCPGCGITRMIISFIKLDFYQAFRYNPFIFMLIVFFMMRGIVSIIRYRKVKPLSNKIILLLLILTILFVILRNIPIFSFLAPTVL